MLLLLCFVIIIIIFILIIENKCWWSLSWKSRNVTHYMAKVCEGLETAEFERCFNRFVGICQTERTGT
jgi:hypothetical protein